MKVVLLLVIAVSLASYIAAQAGCNCPLYDECDCCVSDVPVLNSICVNITWNSQALSITIDLIVNGQVIARETISDPYPPAICETYVCDICAVISNLNITNQGACGSVSVNASCYGFTYNFPIGNFNLGQNCKIPQALPKPNTAAAQSPLGKDSMITALAQRSATKDVLRNKSLKPAKALALPKHR